MLFALYCNELRSSLQLFMGLFKDILEDLKKGNTVLVILDKQQTAYRNGSWL